MEGTWMHRRLVISESYGDKLVHTCPFHPATLSSLMRTRRLACAQLLSGGLNRLVGTARFYLRHPWQLTQKCLSSFFLFLSLDVMRPVSERPASCTLHYPARSGQVYLPNQLQIIAERSVPLLVIMPHAL